jgi:hypothetical protein
VKIKFSQILYCSILTPTPIVLEIDSFLMKIPFALSGFDLFTASINAVRFFSSCATVKEALPIVQ